MILAIKTLISPHGVTPHFIRPLEVWFNLNLLKNLMHRLLEYCDNHLGNRKPSMSSKVSSESVIIIPLRPKVSLVRGSHFCLPLPLRLIILDPFMFINPIHELMHALRWFLCQRLPQFMLSRKANLKCPYCYIFKISIYLIKRLPIPIRVSFQSFTLSHHHGQRGIYGTRNLATCNKLSPESPGELLKKANCAFIQSIKSSHCDKP